MSMLWDLWSQLVVNAHVSQFFDFGKHSTNCVNTQRVEPCRYAFLHTHAHNISIKGPETELSNKIYDENDEERKNIGPIDHGMLWCVLQAWSNRQNFSGKKLLRTYRFRLAGALFVSGGAFASLTRTFVLYDIRNIHEDPVTCIVEPLANVTITAVCLYPVNLIQRQKFIKS